MNIGLKSVCRLLTRRVAFHKSQTLASAVLMVRPVDFTYNPETAQDNEFMQKIGGDATKRALEEFDNSVKVLSGLGVQVVVYDKSKYPEYANIKTPDAVFPNNWFSTMEDAIWTYRMKAPSRTCEKLALNEIIPLLQKEGFHYDKVESWHRSVIEGTGVLLFDRKHKKVFINKSQRADGLLEEYCKTVGFTPILFETASSKGTPIYHTNVMLSIGDDYAVVDKSCIKEEYRNNVMNNLAKDRNVVEINSDQTEKNFCANILQLKGRDGKVLAMSKRAFEGFTKQQKDILGKESKFAVFPLDVIETVGGGSARCMIAEIFLKKHKKATH